MKDPVDRLEVAIGGAFLTTTVAAVALIVTYWRGGQTQLEGIFLGIALAGIAVGLGLWARHAMPGGEAVEEIEPMRSTAAERAGASAEFERGERILNRRGLLGRLLGVGVGAIGAAFLLPLRSLGPRPGRALTTTPWRRGRRLVTDEGDPVRPDDIVIGSMITVFPDGHRSPGDAQTVLIRLPDGVNRPRDERDDWTPGGCIAYSKVCTHAGCPVGLYDPNRQQLVCPCHQSTFEVTDGARPSFGPATRSLPQLPLGVDGDGFLIARGDYSDPVGPAWWSRG